MYSVAAISVQKRGNFKDFSVTASLWEYINASKYISDHTL